MKRFHQINKHTRHDGDTTWKLYDENNDRNIEAKYSRYHGAYNCNVDGEVYLLTDGDLVNTIVKEGLI